MVRCGRTYEEVHEGDIGKVVKVSMILNFISVTIICDVQYMIQVTNKQI